MLSVIYILIFYLSFKSQDIPQNNKLCQDLFVCQFLQYTHSHSGQFQDTVKSQILNVSSL